MTDARNLFPKFDFIRYLSEKYWTVSQANTSILVTGVVPLNIYRFCTEQEIQWEAVNARLSNPWLPANPRAPIDYRDVVKMFDHISEKGKLQDFAEFYVNRVPIVALMISHAVTTGGLYRMAAFAWQRIWPWSVRLRRNEDILEMTIGVHPSAGPSESMMDLAERVLRLMPTAFRRGPRSVYVVDRNPMSAIFEIQVEKDESVEEPDPEMIFEEVRHVIFNVENTKKIPAEWRLTHGEARVVQMLADGNAAKVIAQKLDISHETVRTLLKRAMAKAQARSQVELLGKLNPW